FAADDGRAKHPLFTPASRAAVNRALEEHVAPIARSHGKTLAQVVIAATLEQPGLTSALVGARDEEQARENAGAGELELSAAEVDAVRGALVALDLAPPAAAPPRGGLRGLLARWLGRGGA